MENIILTDLQKEHLWEVCQNLADFSTGYDMLDDEKFDDLDHEIRRHELLVPPSIYALISGFVETEIKPYFKSDILLKFDPKLSDALTNNFDRQFTEQERRFIFLYKHNQSVFGRLPIQDEHQELITLINDSNDPCFVGSGDEYRDIHSNIYKLGGDKIKKGYAVFFTKHLKDYLKPKDGEPLADIYKHHVQVVYGMIDTLLSKDDVTNDDINDLRFNIYLHSPMLPKNLSDKIYDFTSKLLYDGRTKRKTKTDMQNEFTKFCEENIFPILQQ